MKRLLLLVALLSACAGSTVPKAEKFSALVKAPRVWMLEKGPMPITVFFTNPPEYPVVVEWYVCYLAVNGGQCNADNLRFRQVRTLGRMATAAAPLTVQDWIYAHGQRDYEAERDFFNHQDGGEPMDVPNAGGAESMFGMVVVELRILELNDEGKPGRGLLSHRHEFQFDCATCTQRRGR